MKWKAGLLALVLVPCLMGSNCGTTTEKHKIRKQPVWTTKPGSCPKGWKRNGNRCVRKGKVRPRSSVTISCTPKNGKLVCSKP